MKKGLLLIGFGVLYAGYVCLLVCLAPVAVWVCVTGEPVRVDYWTWHGGMKG